MDQRFELFPKIILSNSASTITITSLSDQIELKDTQPCLIRVLPMRRDALIGSYEAYPDQVIYPEKGIIRFAHYFKGEQEHKIDLIIPDKERIEFRVYSVPSIAL